MGFSKSEMQRWRDKDEGGGSGSLRFFLSGVQAEKKRERKKISERGVIWGHVPSMPGLGRFRFSFYHYFFLSLC